MHAHLATNFVQLGTEICRTGGMCDVQGRVIPGLPAVGQQARAPKVLQNLVSQARIFPGLHQRGPLRRGLHLEGIQPGQIWK